MSITAILELRIKQESLPGLPQLLGDVLSGTRGFDGCLSVEVLVDAEDSSHLVVVERWASPEHDAAYRSWRATPEGATTLGTALAAAPVLTRLTSAAI